MNLDKYLSRFIVKNDISFRMEGTEGVHLKKKIGEITLENKLCRTN